MKKILSFVMAAIMTVSVFAMSVVPAMAATVNSPTASTAVNKKPTLQVNGVVTETDIIYSPDKTNPKSITFTYVGEGTLTGWEENLEDLGLAEGTDYTLSYNEDGSLTITFISAEAIADYDNGNVIVNALVDFGTDATTTTKKNNSSKAPATGMSSALAASGIAIACAGIATLTAAKKKDAE